MQHVLFDYGKRCLGDNLNYEYFKVSNNQILWEYRNKLPNAYKNDYVWQNSKRLTLMKCRDCGELFLTYAIDLGDHDYDIFTETQCDKCNSKNTITYNTFLASVEDEEYIKEKYSSMNNWVEHISNHLYGNKTKLV